MHAVRNFLAVEWMRSLHTQRLPLTTGNYIDFRDEGKEYAELQAAVATYLAVLLQYNHRMGRFILGLRGVLCRSIFIRTFEWRGVLRTSHSPTRQTAAADKSVSFVDILCRWQAESPLRMMQPSQLEFCQSAKCSPTFKLETS